MEPKKFLRIMEGLLDVCSPLLLTIPLLRDMAISSLLAKIQDIIYTAVVNMDSECL